VKDLESPRRRKEIEKEHGAIGAGEWNRLRELLAFIDRLNAGDWSPIVTTNVEEGSYDNLAQAIQALNPGGWLVDENESDAKILAYKSASGDGKRLKIKIGELSEFSLIPVEDTQPSSEPVVRPKAVSRHKVGGADSGITVSAEVTTAAFALAEAFTAGLSKTRFVVWWTDVGRKLVPGLYCSDILTALYASVLSTVGTPGGLAVCQRCGEHFIRSRAKQLYCNHKCQVAAAMKRHRGNLKRKAESASKAPTKTKKRTGRK
jgi:hypothetical protein